MKHLFVPYELALLAKEKGFNEPCLAAYRPEDNNELKSYEQGDLMDLKGFKPSDFNSEFLVSAPLYQQLVDWFREKGIYISIECDYDISGGYNRGYTPCVNGIHHFYEGDCFIEYYNALSIGITEAFKLI